MTRVAINGFGRIGRQTFKGMLEHHLNDYEIVAVNDLSNTDMLAHLLKYDSTYGTLDGDVTAENGNIKIEYKGKTISFPVLSERDPAKLPWSDMGVDIVVESTGFFTDASKAKAHMSAGAKKVIISAPAKGEDLTIVLGVNEEKYDPANHHIVSNASCTTNCLAPVANVINDLYGIERGIMTTIHAYTMDQNLQDNIHPKDMRRSRAAAMNMVPTSTGAAKAVALVIPDLKGKFQGYAVRVPTPTVSVVDFTVELSKGTTVEAMNQSFVEASQSAKMKGILGATYAELVSSDYVRDPRSSIVDLNLTTAAGDKLFKVVSWYDNEWGYSVRVGDLVKFMADKM